MLRLNGELLVSPAALKDGDVLEVGKQRLRFTPMHWDRITWE